ncbi:hypothetical protein EIN_399690 [Entamoeba invadens IP1]|uniref:Nucleotidyl transferase domain-containing protein n=1 Tax=Entamoeba invadens IP1 TaxID=370355 RepID=A0A0A1UFU6_ENTIV|nr:hypothetical protein EIN_399690 [Entamoeba invadens IP1]ELP91929.1 hypothetical protein EIN_399690 [Entamoeba invadens IP1]|eukprot:XP_004258700.1 hypothetical protein EIN_399690 [Entamoeba invadens IP1]
MSDYPISSFTQHFKGEFLFVFIEKCNTAKFDSADKPPKCLTMIGEKSIIQWQLEVLEKAEVESVDIVVGKTHEIPIKAGLEKFTTRVKVNVLVYEDAEAIDRYKEENREKILTYQNVFIIGSDLIFDIQTLTAFVNKHRIENSFLSILSSEVKRPTEKKNEKVFVPVEEDKSKDILIVNEKGNVFGMFYGNCKDRVLIPYDLLDRYPSLSVVDEIQTLRTFMVRSSVFADISFKEKLSSLHKDVLPHFIKLLRGRFGQDIYNKTLNDLFSHIPRPFEPPCIYVNATSKLCFRASQKNDIKKAEGMIKSVLSVIAVAICGEFFQVNFVEQGVDFRLKFVDFSIELVLFREEFLLSHDITLNSGGNEFDAKGPVVVERGRCVLREFEERKVQFLLFDVVQRLSPDELEVGVIEEWGG